MSKLAPQTSRARQAGSTGRWARGLALSSVAMLALGACTTKPPVIGGAPNLKVVNVAPTPEGLIDATELPPPTRIDFASDRAPNFLGPEDVLVVTVAGVDWLSNREIRIDSNGELSFPLAGAVTAAGLTPRELESALTERLISRGQMVDPQVSINIKEAQSRTVTIEGEVRRPGIYPVRSRITLLQSIALAQGTNEYSKLDDVVVFRTSNGQDYAALYNLNAIRHGNYPDPEIYPNDIVMVGDERGRRLFQDILRVVPLVTSPLIIAIDRFLVK